MTSATDLFVEEARAVTISGVLPRLALSGLKRIGTGEEAGPCPVAGGRDGFAINTTKNVWNCRKCDDGGKDAIGLAAHVHGLDVKRREDFLEACSIVTGQAVPDGSAISDERRAELQQSHDKARRQAEAEAAKRESDGNAWRDREQAKARGKWSFAQPALRQAQGEGNALGYLSRRVGGFDLPDLPFVRTIASEAYWHGQDEGGRALAIHDGPAMVLPFVQSDGTIVGCHLTWLDPRGPKGRPVLKVSGELLPTKKMRGTKKGGFLPLIGFAESDGHITAMPGLHRLVAGEGIENVLAVAIAEGVRADTLYVAAGDLGNLAGRADPKSGFAHPTLTKLDKNKKPRAVRVPGPVPLAGEDESMPVPDHVTEILLVGDGDSEPYFTMAAMMRAEARLSAPGRLVSIVFPPEPGVDFCDLIAAAEAA